MYYREHPLEDYQDALSLRRTALARQTHDVRNTTTHVTAVTDWADSGYQKSPGSTKRTSHSL